MLRVLEDCLRPLVRVLALPGCERHKQVDECFNLENKRQILEGKAEVKPKLTSHLSCPLKGHMMSEVNFSY